MFVYNHPVNSARLRAAIALIRGPALFNAKENPWSGSKLYTAVPPWGPVEKCIAQGQLAGTPDTQAEQQSSHKEAA